MVENQGTSVAPLGENDSRILANEINQRSSTELPAHKAAPNISVLVLSFLKLKVCGLAFVRVASGDGSE